MVSITFKDVESSFPSCGGTNNHILCYRAELCLFTVIHSVLCGTLHLCQGSYIVWIGFQIQGIDEIACFYWMNTICYFLPLLLKQIFFYRCVILSFDDGTMKTLSLTKAANDVPVTGKPFTRTKQLGLHTDCCLPCAIWSIQISRVTGFFLFLIILLFFPFYIELTLE